MMRWRLLSITTNKRCVQSLLKMASVLHFAVNSASSRPPAELQGIPHVTLDQDLDLEGRWVAAGTED